MANQHRVVGCSTLNSGLFEALVKSKSMTATFCGHDHYSDFVAYKKGIYLCYGRVSSFTPPSNWEGAGGKLPFAPGGRVVELDCDTGQVVSWIHVESGEEPESRVILDGSHDPSPRSLATGGKLGIIFGLAAAAAFHLS